MLSPRALVWENPARAKFAAENWCKISIWHDFNSLDLHHSGCDAYENENFCFIVVSITVPLQSEKAEMVFNKCFGFVDNDICVR